MNSTSDSNPEHLDPNGKHVPDDAPYNDGSDARWSGQYNYITTKYPDVTVELWEIMSAVWDQGAREHADGKGNPFWRMPEALRNLTAPVTIVVTDSPTGDAPPDREPPTGQEVAPGH